MDLDRPGWGDRSGVAVLLVPVGLDPAEHGLTSTVADLARRQDLVVVCGSDGTDAGHLGSYSLTSELRTLLPRRSVIAVLVSDHYRAGTDGAGTDGARTDGARTDGAGTDEAARQEFAAIASLLDNGAVVVAVALASDPVPVAALLARHLETCSLLRLDRGGCRRVSPDPSSA